MINMQTVACTATFMALGMCEVNSRHRDVGPDGSSLSDMRDMYAVWGNGGIELHMELAQYAEISEKIVEFISDECEFDFPGVYDYEVSEPFGAWFTEYLFEHDAAPSKLLAVEQLSRMAVDFFTKHPDPDLMPADLLLKRVQELEL